MKIQNSIVIPAYAEAEIIGDTLDKTYEYLAAKGLVDSTEVIVVAADSNDATKEIAAKFKKFKKLLIIEPGPKKGKGRDVRVGMLAAKGAKVLLWMQT